MDWSRDNKPKSMSHHVLGLSAATQVQAGRCNAELAIAVACRRKLTAPIRLSEKGPA